MQIAPLISIIVPVYNVERYLKKCLESCINQTYSNIEIILVNDGSTDTSLFICEEFTKKSNNVVLINQKNSGVSAARNKGLNKAKGDFIYFLDSDDWLELTMMEELVNLLENELPDVIIFGYAKVNNLGELVSKTKVDFNYSIQMQSGGDKLMSLFDKGIGLTVWDKLIKREIIVKNKLHFNKMRNAEDFIFCIDLYFVCSSIKVIKDVYYNYRIQMEGKRSDNYELISNHILAFDKLLDLANFVAPNSIEVKKVLSNYFLIWFGIVKPLNIISFHKLGFNKKIQMLQTIFKWRRYDYIIDFLKGSQCGVVNKLIWIIIKQKNPYLLFLTGKGLLIFRQIKYK